MKNLEKIVYDKLTEHPKRINHTKGVIQTAVNLYYFMTILNMILSKFMKNI